MVNRASSSKR